MFKRRGIVYLCLYFCLITVNGENENSEAIVDDKKAAIEALKKQLSVPIRPEPIFREISNATISEISTLKDQLLKAPQIKLELSTNLRKMLKLDSDSKSEPVVGIALDDNETSASENPSITTSFQPSVNEIKHLTKLKHYDSDIHNLYRENLRLKTIKEEIGFKIGKNVQVWKTLTLEKETALIGKSKGSIILAIGSENAYKIYDELLLEKSATGISMEVFTLWDHDTEKVRNLLVIAQNSEIIWYELIDKKIVQIRKWRLMKNIDQISFFNHDGTDLLMVISVNEKGRVEVQFIEFNFSTEEFSVVQSFKLPNKPSSIACLDAGKEFLVAFTQNSHIKIYRHQSTKFERGRFTFMKSIDAVNASVISAFRIGGYSYLAVGGDQSQILRYTNGDFQPQTILSQTFGYVEEFLPIPIKIFRDDLVLLVQHKISFHSHSVIAVDALIWNGVAFESALSIPCKVVAKPESTGFTCMLDFEREKGLLGATFVVQEKNNSFYIVIPRHETHSGLFRVNYDIVEAEDPLVKEMEQVKKAIELINEMLDAENAVKQQVDEVLKNFVNPKENFRFENLEIDSIDSDMVHFDGNVILESDRIDFLDTSYSREDFLANLDQIEATLLEDEMKLKELDEEVDKLTRTNRQITLDAKSSSHLFDSPIYYYGPYSFNGRLNPQTIRVLPQDDHKTRRQKRQIAPIDERTIPDLNVRDIYAETINGIPVKDFLFLQNNGELHVPYKNIVFKESVHAGNVGMLNDGRVNGIDFSHDVLAIDSPNLPKSLSFENIEVVDSNANHLNEIAVDAESLQKIDLNFDDAAATLKKKTVKMRDNLVVETINGVDWNEFTSKLIAKNSESSARNLTVNGNVWLVDNESNLNIETLNYLAFPQEYVLKAGPQSTVITGKKFFNKSLATSAIDTEGTINGISPMNLIPLDQEQTIQTDTTFNVMEVSKKLEVHGKIAGQKLDEFLPNPTLELANNIPAACSFSELVVDGVVKIENALNNFNLEEILSDVVYESPNSDEEVVINSKKIFQSLEIEGDAVIPSNYVSHLKLDDIMTVDGEQMATFDKVFGSVFFTNLKTDGTFDGVNVTDLEMNSIRTFGDQYIQTPIIIQKHVDARSVEVKHALNTIPVEDFYSINLPVVFPDSMRLSFNDAPLNIKNLKLKGVVIGSGILGKNGLEELYGLHLSRSAAQVIPVRVEIRNLITKNVFKSNFINNLDFGIFLDYMRDLRNFKNVLLSGKHRLDSLVIDGNVNLTAINDQEFNSIIDNVIWLNRPNTIDGSLEFLDEIEVDGKLILNDKLNRKNFNEFVTNWVSSTENPIKVSGTKFVKNAMVSDDLQLSEINGIKYEDILRKQDSPLHTLKVMGIVYAKNVNVGRYFNRESVENLNEIYSHDKEMGTHIINTDVILNHNCNVTHLSTPILNERNVSDWLSNLIRLDDAEIDITSSKMFEGGIWSDNGIFIDTFNHIAVNDLLKNLVILRSDQIVNIYSNILFKNDFYASLVGLRGNLTTDSIGRHSIPEWINHAKPIDRSYYYDGHLKADSRLVKAKNIFINKLNGIPFNHIFTLHTNQSFNHKISVMNSVIVQQPLIVHGTVNHRILKNERENTVMRNEKDQVISTNVVLPAAIVMNSVTAKKSVNSKDISKIVSLHSSPTLYSSIGFTSLEARSLQSDYPISNINFTHWYHNALWKAGRSTQVISGRWKLKQALLRDDVYGNGLINERPINEIEKNLKININAIEMAISNYSGQYEDMCSKLHDRAENFAQNSVYMLKYFVNDFTLSESSEIISYFAFRTDDGRNYLLVNTLCTTNVYLWDQKSEKFSLLHVANTGIVEHWAKLEPKVSSERNVFIISSSKSKAEANCEKSGLNTWKLVDDKLMPFEAIASDHDIVELHVEEQNPNSFYALKKDNHVVNYNVHGAVLEQWKLPTENISYAFLPSGIVSGLSLSNGRRIFLLNSRYLRRGKRFLYDITASKIQLPKIERKFNESTAFTLKIPDLQLNDRKHSIPTIPSKPMRTAKPSSFLAKVREAGEVIKKSYSGYSKETVIPDLQKNAQASNDGKAITDLKVSKLNGPNKLLFVINSPNITSLRESLGLNRKDSEPLMFDLFSKQNVSSTINEPLENATESSEIETTTDSVVSDSLPFTPRIIMPPEENTVLQTEPPSEADEETERHVEATLLQGSGIQDMENNFIPEKESGEVTVLYVGAHNNRRPLYAIKRRRDSFIKGSDFIEIYSDIIEGRVFQYIQCTSPSHIVALHFRDETLLAFMESQKEVQIFIYRGIEGFTFFRKIALSTEAVRMTSLTLPPKLDYKCDHQYLVIQTYRELLFMGVKIEGNCGPHVLSCDKN